MLMGPPLVDKPQKKKKKRYNPRVKLRRFTTVQSWEVKVKLPLCFSLTPRHEGVLGGGGTTPLIL
jgi:hypothetical protein